MSFLINRDKYNRIRYLDIPQPLFYPHLCRQKLLPDNIGTCNVLVFNSVTVVGLGKGRGILIPVFLCAL